MTPRPSRAEALDALHDLLTEAKAGLFRSVDRLNKADANFATLRRALDGAAPEGESMRQAQLRRNAHRLAMAVMQSDAYAANKEAVDNVLSLLTAYGELRGAAPERGDVVRVVQELRELRTYYIENYIELPDAANTVNDALRLLERST